MLLTDLKTFAPISTYSLTNVKVAEFASDETLCFRANIMQGRKKIATVSNDGHGGPDWMQFVNKEEEKLFMQEAHKLRVKKFLAELDAMHPDKPNSNHTEYEMSSLVEQMMEEAQAMKHAKTWFTYLQDGNDIGSYSMLKMGRKKVPHNHPALKKWLEENGSDIVLVSKNHWANQEVVAK